MIGPSARADAARAVEHADARRRASANRKDTLAEDRQQEQHAASEAPAGLDEHQRRNVRARRDVAEAFDEVGDARERQETGDARIVGGVDVVPRPADEERRHEERRRVDDERDVSARNAP